jgi:NAD(P)-dependent dehydrogenase (short-subunit alcohol dehydrogenase family)
VSELRFDGRVAVISGAARGLGHAYAQFLTSLGALVVMNDIDAEALRNAQTSLPGTRACAADVSDAAGARAVINAALDAFGRVDIVIANAGTSWEAPFGTLDGDDVARAMTDNFTSAFQLVHAAWPHLVEQRYGRVVLTASGAVFGFAGRAHYAAAKGAVLALANTLAIEGGLDGIQVNTVLPWGATRMARPDSAAPDPGLCAPGVAWLCHEACTETGGAFVLGGGRVGRVQVNQPQMERVAAPTLEAYRYVLGS